MFWIALTKVVMDTDFRAQLGTREDSLRRYLPQQLLHPLLHRPGLATARPCVDHLDDLLRAVVSYLPRYLVHEQLRDPRPGQVSGEFREATIMFADISGFTAMSEQLSSQGEQGSERIATIVSNYFTAMLDITACQGGDLLKFGGDALLVAFFGPDHALAACQAAVHMQRAIDRFKEVEAFGQTFGLKMTVGLGSGPLFTANLGSVKKMEYTVMGEALANMAHAEDQAKGGEIAIDQATYQAAMDHVGPSGVQVGEKRDGCYLLTHVEGARSRAGPSLPPEPLPQLRGQGLTEVIAHLVHTVSCLDALVPYLPPGLLDLLRFAPTRMASREQGEFRPVTVIFANFYGIEDIIRQLGPPKLAEITAILNTHFSQMQEIIDRYEGVIDKVDSYVVGHRIMALFGAPRAHVDDPERAVRAAWEMQAAMSSFAELETSAGTFALKQRIGINTGRVFAGNVGSQARHEYSVMGDEVNLTARLMSAAQEGEVLISQSTAAQVGDRFRLREMDPVRVKGKSQPVPNYQVGGVLARHATGQLVRRLPMVGREAEWQVVQRIARLAAQGSAQVLDLHGEMGMGKSRMIEELIAHWTRGTLGARAPARRRAAFFSTCLSYGRHTPYAPWAAILRELYGLREGDTAQEQQEKIASRLAATSPEWVEWAPLVAQVLGVSMPESELLRALDPRLRQQNLQRLLGSLIASEAAYHPTLLVIDDVQWIDEASLALLNHLIAHLRASPLLICVAYRPEEAPALTGSGQDNYTAVPLGALSEADSLALLDSQLPTDPQMPQRLKELILANAQGNAMYIVEMAHALIDNYLRYDAESGVYRARADLERVQVPDTISRVILSRLDRLDEQSRNMLKVASVIGRAFQRWLLQSVYPFRVKEAEMEALLHGLCDREILDRAQVAYLFRHVMTREVAYESLLYAERRALHAQIAQSIEAQGPHLEDYLEVLAEHYTLAEAWPQALDYQLQAGHRAQSVYANQDAIHRYRQALEIAQHVPDSESQRLAAYQALGDVYQLIGRYDESLNNYAQAQALLGKISPFPDAVRLHADLCMRTARVHEFKGEYAVAQEWIDEGLARLGTDTGSLEAARLYLMRGGIYHRQGNHQGAIQWCERAMQVAESEGSREGAREMAHAAFLIAEIYRRQGNTDQAVAFAQRSLQVYQELKDVIGQGQAHNTLGNAYSDDYNWQAGMEHYLKGLAIKERIGDVYGQGVLAINIGENHRLMGQLDQAIAFYGRSLQVWEELGATYGKGLAHNNLGAVYLRMGELERATEHLDRSEALFRQIPSDDYAAESSRYRAEVALAQGDPARARSLAERSLEFALAQGLKADECAAHRALGLENLAQGDLEGAANHLSQSLRIAQELQDPYQTGRTLLQTGRLALRQGRAEEARALFHQARALFERLEARLDLREVDQELSGSTGRAALGEEVP